MFEDNSTTLLDPIPKLPLPRRPNSDSDGHFVTIPTNVASIAFADDNFENEFPDDLFQGNYGLLLKYFKL